MGTTFPETYLAVYMKSLKNMHYLGLGDASLKNLRFMYKDVNPGLMYNRKKKTGSA